MRNSRRSLTVAVRKALIEYEVETFHARQAAERERLELNTFWRQMALTVPLPSSEASHDVKDREDIQPRRS